MDGDDDIPEWAKTPAPGATQAVSSETVDGDIPEWAKTPVPQVPLSQQPDSQILHNALPNTPGYTYGDILPFKKNNQTGDVSLAWPTMVRSAVHGAGDLYQDAENKTTDMTPDAINAMGAMAGATGIAKSAAEAIPGAYQFTKDAISDLRSPISPRPLTSPQRLNSDLGLDINGGNPADIHQQIQNGVSGAVDAATNAISGGKPFNGKAAIISMADRQQAFNDDIANNLKPKLLASGEGVATDTTPLEDRLAKTVADLKDKTLGGTSSADALKMAEKLQAQVAQYNGQMPLSDLLDLRAQANELYAPGLEGSGRKIIGDTVKTIRQMVQDTAEDARSMGNDDLADNLHEYDTRIADLGDVYKNSRIQKFFNDDIANSVKQMDSRGRPMSIDETAHSDTMVDNIKDVHDIEALKPAMDPDNFNALRAEKLQRIIDQAKDPNTGNYNLNQLRTILNPKNIITGPSRAQTSLIQSLVNDNPEAQKILSNVQELSDNLTSRGLKYGADNSIDLAKPPSLMEKASGAAGKLINAASFGSAKGIVAPIVKNVIKGVTNYTEAPPTQDAILQNFARDAYIKNAQPASSASPSPQGIQPFLQRQPGGAFRRYTPPAASAPTGSILPNNTATRQIGSMPPDNLNLYPSLERPVPTLDEHSQLQDLSQSVNDWDAAAARLKKEYGLTYKEVMGKLGARPDEYNGQKRGGSVYARGGAVNTNPTPAQKMAGNYKKQHVKFHGLNIAIENPKGSERSGIGRDGKEWRSTMPAHYGYIKRTQGADGDHMDVYMGDNERSKRIYVIDQKDADTGQFDEHKCILNCGDRDEALALYKQSFSDGKAAKRIGHVRRMSIPEFKTWLKHGDTRQPIKRAS